MWTVLFNVFHLKCSTNIFHIVLRTMKHEHKWWYPPMNGVDVLALSQGFNCLLGCWGVRLPSSCALHIFPCIFPSNPLIACFYVRRWFLKFALWLMVWSCLSSCVIQRGRWRGGGLCVGLHVCILLLRRCMWCIVSCRISPSQISTHNITWKIRTKSSTTRHRYMCKYEGVVW